MGGTLASLEHRLTTVDLGECSEPELAKLTRSLHRAGRWVQGQLTRVAAEAKRREEAGGSPAEDVVRSAGEVSRREAERVTERAGLAEVWPEVAAEVEAGRARPENADVLARRAKDLTPAQRQALGAHDRELADRARRLPPETFARHVGRLIARATEEGGPSRAERQRAASRFRMGRRADGMWWLSGLLDPERGAELHAALAATAQDLGEHQEFPSTDNAWAAALHHLATRGPADGSGGGGGSKLGIGYVVDARTMAGEPHEGSVAETWGGDPVAPESIPRLACDTDLYAILINEVGEPHRVGRTRRAATREQRLQLRALYRGCPLDGTPFEYCDIHHVNVFWDDHGDTDLDNLLPISSAWHHRIHDRGWVLKMAPDRSLKLWRPDGTLEREIPPPTPITRQRE